VLQAYDLEQSMVETFSRIFFGAMSAAGSAVTAADDPARSSAEVEAAIAFILTGMRRLAESGAGLSGPAEVLAEHEEGDDAPGPVTEAAGETSR
jgi:hypothetical protein